MEYVGREIVEKCLSIATALLEHGIQVGIPDRRGLTELHHAVSQNDHYWLRKRMPGVVHLLVSRSTVDVNALGPGGLAPLHLAAKAGWLEVVRILVEQGNADITETDNFVMSLDLFGSNTCMEGMYYPVPMLARRCLLITGVLDWEWLEHGLLVL